MDEFVLWQEFVFVVYGPLIYSAVGVTVASGILIGITIIMAAVGLDATRSR